MGKGKEEKQEREEESGRRGSEREKRGRESERAIEDRLSEFKMWWIEREREKFIHKPPCHL